MAAGMERHEASHLLLQVLVPGMYRVLKGTADFDLSTYRARLKYLTRISGDKAGWAIWLHRFPGIGGRGFSKARLDDPGHRSLSGLPSAGNPFAGRPSHLSGELRLGCGCAPGGGRPRRGPRGYLRSPPTIRGPSSAGRDSFGITAGQERPKAPTARCWPSA